MRQFVRLNALHLSILVFIVLLIFTRVILFVNSYGGLEHDSGWNLGLAKNLGLRGIYASYTNTVSKEGYGIFPNIHHRLSLQDEKGYVYFPGSINAGPGYVVPEAILLNLFGSGWWQYRAWPLLAFLLLLFLLFFIVWRFGGLIGLLFFGLWLWLVPQFTAQMAYEALSEHIALLFLLAGYYILYLFDQKKRLWFAFTSGLLFAFSYLTKTIFLLPAFGVLVYLQCDYFRYDKDKKLLLKKWLLFFLGLIIPVLAFNLYKYTTVISHFGSAGWVALKQEEKLVFAQSGSGLDPMTFVFQSPVFLSQKLLVWEDAGIRLPVLIWLILILTPVVFLKFLPVKGKIFCSALYLAAVISFFWYLFFSTDGWARHIWPGLMLGMLLISIFMGLLHHHFKDKQRILFWVISLVICLFTLNYSVINAFPLLDRVTITTWKSVRKIRGLDGFPSNPVLSLSDQLEVLGFFQNNIKPDDRVYYLQKYLIAEISPLVDKVFYPVERYIADNCQNPQGGGSVVIIGPYQQGIWSNASDTYLSEAKSVVCDRILMQNPSYLICSLKPDLDYEKNASWITYGRYLSE